MGFRDLNIAMILKLRDQATGPARRATENLTRMSNRVASGGLRSLELSDRVGEFNKRRTSALRGQTFGMIGLGAAIYGAMRPAVRFEAAMAKVGAVSRASEADLIALTAQARQLGETTPWAASQAAEGMQFLAMAGFSVNETMTAMPGLLNLASAGAEDLGRTSDIASNILTGFGIEADRMGQVGDVLTSTFTSSNTTLAMLGDTMKYVAPVAASMNVSLETSAAMAGKLGDAGIQGQQAGTALRAILSRLAAPANEGAKALKKLGIETQDAKGNLRDMPSILADMNYQMEGMGTAARADIIAAVFGLEAASAATVLLGEAGSGSLQEYIEKLNDVEGATERVAKAINDNTAGAITKLKSASEGLSIAFGTLLLPQLSEMLELLLPVVKSASEWANANPDLVSSIGKWAGALLAVNVGLLAMKWTLSPLITAVRAGIWVWGATAIGMGLIGTALTALVTLATAHPLVLMVAALAAGALLIYENWDGIVGYFEGVISKIREMFASLVFWDQDGLPVSGVVRNYTVEQQAADRLAFSRKSAIHFDPNAAPITTGSAANAERPANYARITTGDIIINPAEGASGEDIGAEIKRYLDNLSDAALYDGGAN